MSLIQNKEIDATLHLQANDARAIIDKATASSNADLYGDSLDHGNPLAAAPNNIPTLVRTTFLQRRLLARHVLH